MNLGMAISTCLRTYLPLGTESPPETPALAMGPSQMVVEMSAQLQTSKHLLKTQQPDLLQGKQV